MSLVKVLIQGNLFNMKKPTPDENYGLILDVPDNAHVQVHEFATLDDENAVCSITVMEVLEDEDPESDED